ncbi:pentapeptide repeat-containing protein [Saccharibacillus qingshengii]|uniref:pentapeptide repeat-containing protein n=1 Tax=Saccharibacillus qingshengii TaxID=1763540 RepID=UPI001555868F|nr:pentapeptide repeat-containing protein [Saccharibacillus qingshengii]
MFTPIEIGNKIAEARKAKNLSQALLARQLSLSPQAVGKWERGESLPDILTLDRLAQILDLDLNHFSQHFRQTAAEPPSTAEPAKPQDSLPETAAPAWNMSEGSWVDADFSGLEGLHEQFGSSFIRRSLFVGAHLPDLLLKSNYVEECDFSNAELGGSRFEHTHMTNSLFLNASLTRTVFAGSHLAGCDLSGANLTETGFESSQLQNCTLTGVVWTRTRFHGTHLTGLVLEGMFEGCSFENCAFSDVTFRNATLTRTFFKNKTLKKVRFIDCKADRLTYSFLKSGKADLSGITLIDP